MTRRTQLARAPGAEAVLTMTVLLFVAVSCFPCPVRAAVISYAGSDLLTQDAWRTSSEAKNLDADGNNVYGTDGYWMFMPGQSGLFNGDPFYLVDADQPAYVSLVADGGVFSIGWPAFADIDDPDNAPDDYNSGCVGRTVAGQGDETSFFNITFSGSVPEYGVRVGVLVNNCDADNPASIRMSLDSNGAVTASASTVTGDARADYHFFDITEIQDGDTFSFFATDTLGGATEIKGIGGFMFDAMSAPVPEPSALGLLALGVLLLRMAGRYGSTPLR